MLVKGGAAHTVIAFSYLLIIVYALTLAPICWVYAAEVWSLETRGIGMSISSLGNWLNNFALGLYVPPAFRNILWKIFIIFAVLCFAAAVYFYLTFPETCGKTLEEIEFMFSKEGPHPWKTKKGGSRLDAEIAHVIEAQAKGLEVHAGVVRVVDEQEKGRISKATGGEDLEEAAAGEASQKNETGEKAHIETV